MTAQDTVIYLFQCLGFYVIYLFQYLDFVVNQGKSVLSPVEFLEGAVDSKSMTLKLTEERVLKISTLQSNFSQPRDIHS